MTMERMTVAVEWQDIKDNPNVPDEWKAKADDDKGNLLVGYASTFGNVDLGGDVVMAGAFTKTLDNIKANGIPLLADHMGSVANVLGTIFDAKEDTKGLLILARLSAAPSAQDTAIKLREGHLSKLSIGYETMNDSYEERDGRRVRLLHEVKLWETSVVVFPMNPEATVQGMKALAAAAVEAGQTPEQIDAVAKGYVLDIKDLKPFDANTANTTTLPSIVLWKSMLAVEQATGVASDSSGPASETQDAPPAGSSGTSTRGDDESTKATDEGAKAGDDGGSYDRFRSAAMLAGRDTGDVDEAKRAELRTRLALAEGKPLPDIT